MNIYAELYEPDAEQAIYLYGTDSGNMTGKVKIYTNLDYEILCSPEGERLSNVAVIKLISSNREQLSKGLFPKKMSHEVG